MTEALVAAGHDVTADAAVAALTAGGNAYDAVIAAGFAAAVAEPTLTSLAGGGFLLARTAEGDERLFDFFVDTPGRGRVDATPHFVEVTVSFPSSTQDFNVGWGSAAVPGVLAGYLHVHRELGRLPLEQVVGPAVTAGRRGVVLNEQQAGLVELLAPILTVTDEAAAVFAPGGRMLATGDTMVQAELAEFLERIGSGRITGFDDPAVAGPLVGACDRSDGLITAPDLAAYRVIERRPLEVRHRGRRVLTNPPPSFGGSLLGLALALLDGEPGRSAAERAVRHLEVMQEVDRARLSDDVERRLKVARGTTHLSVADHEGNVASMTTSNGEGAGCLVPGTGVMLNNMLGEDDLHPDGFHSAPPGERVASMMCPTVVVGPDGGCELVVGSGGSKRIRTALAQVVSAALADPELGLAEIIEAPRMHWDGEVLQVEPGRGEETLRALDATGVVVNRWTERNLYFGGVHAVRPGAEAAGDPRRGGTVRKVTFANG